MTSQGTNAIKQKVLLNPVLSEHRIHWSGISLALLLDYSHQNPNTTLIARIYKLI